MTEQELVNWFKSSVKEGLQVAMQLIDDAESFDDLKRFQKRMRGTAKDLKDGILMMENYVDVNKAIMNKPNN